jgi:Tol biopolymer transport system component
VERIGAGGMGEVYRARDVDLDRDVAIKVLPSDFTGSEERVRRFVQEAKSASGLNHPNIVVIHEIGSAELDGAKHHFIAMELIDGETLRQKIDKPHRDLKTLLGYAAQCADALAKAHAAGIVHRDLKPDNLMVTRDGFAKVLDFGLAKLTETFASNDTATIARPDTREGMVMGTVGYMSPEQAQGLPVDGRSDIFSFGCILYELATGERAFKGTSQVDVLHAIVHDNPPPVTDVNPNVPAELRRIIRRCIAKDPDQRFHSMKDLASTLRDLVDEYDQLTPGSGSAARIAPVPARRRPWGLIAAATALAVSVLLFLIWKNAKPAAVASPTMKVTRITANGVAAQAAISPDGRYIAYIFNDRGNGIRVRQVATQSEIVVRPPTEEVSYDDVAFSRDGERIFVRTRPRGSMLSTLVAIPSLGGESRSVISDIDSAAAFSPDEKSVAFVRVDPGGNATQLIVGGAGGTGERVLASEKQPGRFTNVAWSPDGKWIAAIVSTTEGGLQARVELISPDGKTKQPLTTERWLFIASMVWLPDSSGIIASAQKEDVRRNQLWYIPYPSGRSTPITSDFSHYGSASLSADGKALLAVQGQERPRIWKVDLATGNGEPITDERAASTPWFFHDIAADGAILYYTADNGNTDIWSMLPDGSPPKRVTDSPAVEFSPSLTRAGDVIYFEVENERGFELWSMDRSGGSRRRIASLPPANTDIAASPDGRWVLYPTPTELLRFSTADGSRRVLTPLPPEFAAYSPDGTKIAFGVRDSPRRRTAIIDAESGQLLQEVPRAPEQYSPRLAWAPDGKSLFVKELRDGATNLWMLSLDSGTRRQLTHFTDRGTQIGAFNVTPDGKSLYVGRAALSGDVVLITDFRR